MPHHPANLVHAPAQSRRRTGPVLVKRGQRFEGFTEAGERILAWARTLLAAHDGLQAEAASCRGQVVGSLRLGTVPLASFNPMHLLLPLREKYPELHFQVSSLSSEQIIDGLSRNQLDLGICYRTSQYQLLRGDRTRHHHHGPAA